MVFAFLDCHKMAQNVKKFTFKLNKFVGKEAVAKTRRQLMSNP